MERLICNPAWDIWTRTFGCDPHQWDAKARNTPEDVSSDESHHQLRWLVSQHMAFAIPSPWHLAEVARYEPLVEIGAGTGYWAWCLRQLGVDIVAYDRFPPETHPAPPGAWRGVLAAEGKQNAWFDCYWTEVKRAGASAAGRHKDRTMLLIWPYGTMAHQALEAYRGDRVIFIGEWDTPATNDPRFFRLLERDWNQVTAMPMPQWDGTHHEFMVFQRDPGRPDQLPGGLNP